MKPTSSQLLLLAVIVPAVVLTFRAAGRPTGSATTTSEPGRGSPVERGRYLVRLGGCTDCHTPKSATPEGPADDMAYYLAGHPAATVVAPPPDLGGDPMAAATTGMTAWSGPWGTSFASNITPDPDTGIGAWTEEEFTLAMRTGLHRGDGRPILPPMPWQSLAELTEGDLKAVFAYLRSVPPVKNQVPPPAPPASHG